MTVKLRGKEKARKNNENTRKESNDQQHNDET